MANNETLSSGNEDNIDPVQSLINHAQEIGLNECEIDELLADYAKSLNKKG